MSMRDNLKFNAGPIIINDGLRKYMISVFNKMFLALGLTGIVAYLCASSPEIITFMSGGFKFILMIATFGIVIYLGARINKISAEKAEALFWLYAAVLGAFLSPIVYIYTSASIANAFFTTAIFFGGMSLFGYVTKKDLTGVGSFMTVGLFAIIITSFINIIFLKSSALQVGISAICVIIFCGLTAYDVQKIKSFYLESSRDDETLSKRATLGALSLYMDFINLFLAMIRLFGDRR